jgi:hypothetical protein
MQIVYGVGHSNHPIEKFLNLLKGVGVDHLIDVRNCYGFLPR